MPPESSAGCLSPAPARPTRAKNRSATARRSARMEGLALGISSGAALSVALRLAALPANAGKRIICIAPSFAERYMSTALFAGLD